MKIIDKFEKDFGVLSRTLTADKFEKILSSEEFEEYKEPKVLYELLNEISQVNQNEDFSTSLYIMSSMTLLSMTEIDILEVFRKYREEEIDRDTLVKEMSTMIDDQNLIRSFTGYLCTMMSLEDIEIEKEKLQNRLIDFKKLYERLSKNMSISYMLIIDLLDLIFKIREEYFKKYEEDIFDDEFAKWIAEALVEIHDFEDIIVNKDIPNIDIKPEELGLLDITKLKERKE